jgi:hypothetical protein
MAFGTYLACTPLGTGTLVLMARTRGGTVSRGTSLTKGPVGIVGMILLAYGVTGLVFGGNSFSSNPLDGTVTGETWLGIEGNGWSNLLAIGAGGLLMFCAQIHVIAKTMALLVGLAFAAAAVIALVDGDDVLGIFAANDATKLAWAIAAAVLIVLALLPRVGRRTAEPATEDASALPPGTAAERRPDERYRHERDPEPATAVHPDRADEPTAVAPSRRDPAGEDPTVAARSEEQATRDR